MYLCGPKQYDMVVADSETVLCLSQFGAYVLYYTHPAITMLRCTLSVRGKIKVPPMLLKGMMLASSHLQIVYNLL